MLAYNLCICRLNAIDVYKLNGTRCIKAVPVCLCCSQIKPPGHETDLLPPMKGQISKYREVYVHSHMCLRTEVLSEVQRQADLHCCYHTFLFILFNLFVTHLWRSLPVISGGTLAVVEIFCPYLVLVYLYFNLLSQRNSIVFLQIFKETRWSITSVCFCLVIGLGRIILAKGPNFIKYYAILQTFSYTFDLCFTDDILIAAVKGLMCASVPLCPI